MFSFLNTFGWGLHSKLARKLKLFEILTYYYDPDYESDQDDNVNDLIGKASTLVGEPNFSGLLSW